MQNFDKVPCLQVNSKNFNNVYPSLINNIIEATFIGLDFEFSGLGDKKIHRIYDLNLRYEAMKSIIEKRSVLSIGLSTFKLKNNQDIITSKNPYLNATKRQLEEGECKTDVWHYEVQNYNIICKCEGEFIKDESALEFLKEHGFDFNLIETNAILYKKGSDFDEDLDEDLYEDLDEDLDEDLNEKSLKNIFLTIMQEKIPIVFHNAFYDLLYLYHHFHYKLPNNLYTFLSELSQMFEGGIFDTKLISIRNTYLTNSFLEFLFYHYQRTNLFNILKYNDYIYIDFTQAIEQDVELCNLQTKFSLNKSDDTQVCIHYKKQGWCPSKSECKLSHNIDFILDSDFDKNKNKNEILKNLKILENSINIITQKNNSESDDENQKISSKNEDSKHVKLGIHQSGYDAFMTGFCFSIFISEFYDEIPQENKLFNLKDKCEHIYNLIFMSKYVENKLKIKNYCLNLSNI